jgi:hypothetical protein
MLIWKQFLLSQVEPRIAEIMPSSLRGAVVWTAVISCGASSHV